MKTHRLVSVAFLVSSIFCSSLNAQTDQPVAVQLSGLFNRTDTNDRWEWGGEGQVRWTGEAWSLGVGVQYTSSGQTNKFLEVGRIGDIGSHDYSVSTLGLFLEPRFVFMAFADRFGLYFQGRVAVSRVSENESGRRESSTVFDMFGNPVGSEPYSLEGTLIAPSAFLGPGLLMRLNSRVNLDLGTTGGYAWWGERIREPNVSFRPKFFFVMGAWVGLVIGIG